MKLTPTTPLLVRATTVSASQKVVRRATRLDGGEGGILFLKNWHLFEFRADSKYLHDYRNVSDCLLGLAGSIKSIWCPPEIDTKQTPNRRTLA